MIPARRNRAGRVASNPTLSEIGACRKQTACMGKAGSTRSDILALRTWTCVSRSSKFRPDTTLPTLHALCESPIELIHRRRFASSAAIAAAILAAAPSVAHHSYARYDNSRTRTLQGVVDTFSCANPHVSFKILVSAAKSAAEVWTIETHSPSILRRYGWTKDSLRPGTRVRIFCIPSRDGAHWCRLLTVVLLNRHQTLETKLLKSFKALPQ